MYIPTEHSPTIETMVKTVTKHYKRLGIQVEGCLKEDLRNRNLKALMYPYYCISNLLSANGMPELLEQLASIKNLGNDGHRRYYNLLTELFGVYFVRKVLRFKILEVESKTNKITSPYSLHGKHCDIKAKKKSTTFFEVKDSSAQIITRYIEKSTVNYTPMEDEKIEKWLKTKTKEAARCGANFLICRVPVWLSNVSDKKEFYDFWPDRIFRQLFSLKQKLSPTKIVLSPNFKMSSHLKGIYIVKEFGYLKLALV